MVSRAIEETKLFAQHTLTLPDPPESPAKKRPAPEMDFADFAPSPPRKIAFASIEDTFMPIFDDTPLFPEGQSRMLDDPPDEDSAHLIKEAQQLRHLLRETDDAIQELLSQRADVARRLEQATAKMLQSLLS